MAPPNRLCYQVYTVLSNYVFILSECISCDFCLAEMKQSAQNVLYHRRQSLVHLYMA